MATLQVLDREPALNPNAGNQFVEGMRLASDIEYKRGMLKQAALDSKLRAQEATTEEEKVKWESLKTRQEVADKIIESAAKQSQKRSPQGQLYTDKEMFSKLMSTAVTSYPSLAETLAEAAKNAPEPTGEQQLLNKLGGGGMGPGGSGGLPQAPVAGEAPTGAAPNAAAAQMVGGQVPTAPMNPMEPVLSGGTLRGEQGNYNFEIPGVQSNIAGMKTEASNRATKAVEMEPIKASVDNYLKTFDAAVEEMGGLETNALAALGKGKIAQISAQLGDKPNTFTLSKLIEPVSLQLGSWLNKGRPTDKDQAAAKDTLTRLTYTKGANEILRNYLKKIIETGDEATGWTVWNALRTGNTKLFTEGANATSNFIIRKK